MDVTTSRTEIGDFQIQLEPGLSVAEFVDVLKRSTLAERRPIHDDGVIAGMLRHADLIVTARTSDLQLIGVARSITDFHYCTYLSDLAVDIAFQRRGIGKQLIDFSYDKAGKKTTLVLLSAPAATTYYPRIGMTQHDSCWIKKGDA
jgi:ribosomal protein S18 acetylase RimI-like enzyme